MGGPLAMDIARKGTLYAGKQLGPRGRLSEVPAGPAGLQTHGSHPLPQFSPSPAGREKYVLTLLSTGSPGVDITFL